MKTIGLLGGMSWKSTQVYYRIIKDQINQGAQGIILGCTELPLLLSKNDISVPVFDTTRIHAHAAVALALNV